MSVEWVKLSRDEVIEAVKAYLGRSHDTVQRMQIQIQDHPDAETQTLNEVPIIYVGFSKKQGELETHVFNRDWYRPSRCLQCGMRFDHEIHKHVE